MTVLEATDQLTQALEFFPHDFVRDEEFLTRARSAYGEHLSRELPQEDDLQLRGSYWDAQADREKSYRVYAERLPWDSRFFSRGVAKLNAVICEHPTIAIALWEEYAQKRDIRYAFTVVPAEETWFVRDLCALGWQLIETRVTYHRTLHDYQYDERYRVRIADKADLSSLMETAREVRNPFDRFRADPTFAPYADRLMELWVANSVNGEFDDLVLVPDVLQPKAWVSIRYHRDMWGKWGYKLSRPGNGAVDPSMAGWYTKLVSEVCYHLKDMGVQHIYIPGSVCNRAVIAAWQKLGLKYGHTEYVFRLVL